MKKSLARLSVLLFCLIPSHVLAFTAPSSGDTGFELYEFVTDNIMDGAIGITICICIVAYGAYWVVRSNIFGALACFVAAILFYSSEDIAEAIGCMQVVGEEIGRYLPTFL